jgi:tyrosine-protein kinase Etk/Wzc
MVYPISDNENDLIVLSKNQFDIKKFLFKLFRHFHWILLSVLVAYFIGKVYLRYTPELHFLTANLLIKDEEEASSDYKILKELGVMPGAKEVQNQIDILQSYGLIRNIIDSLNLEINISTEGHIASTPLYGPTLPLDFHIIAINNSTVKKGTYELKIYENRFSLTKNEKTTYYSYGEIIELCGYKVFFTKNANTKLSKITYVLSILDRQTVVKDLSRVLDVRKLSDMGGIIAISIYDQNANRGIDILNTLIKTFNTAGVTDKNIIGLKTVRFLNERIDTVAQELRAIETQAERFKSVNKITDESNAGDEYLTQVMNYDNLGIAQKSEFELLISLESFIRNSKNLTDIIPSSNTLTEPTLLKLIDEYNTSVLEYQKQTQISTEKDPSLARIRTDLTELKGNILKNIQSIKSAYIARINQLQSTKINFELLLASVPEKERELLSLKRQISVKEQLYLYLLQKREETNLALSSNINNTRVIDAAFDQGVTSPNKPQVLLTSLLLGFILPVVAIVLVDFFYNKIQDKKEIQEGTGAPVIGELTFERQNTMPIVHLKSRSIIAEQLRLICTNFKYINDGKIKTILVTSFMSGEGKSFVSINLASTLSTPESKVLLLELDLRKPKFSKYLNLEPQYGLTDLLISNKHYTEAVVHSSYLANVDIITSGNIPPNPHELLTGKRLKEVIDELQQHYDMIVIDSSPIGLVADTYSLEEVTDLPIFILRQKYSYKTTLKFIESLRQENKFKQLSIVVNGITDMKSFGYGYGYLYGYYHKDKSYGERQERNVLSRLFYRNL